MRPKLIKPQYVTIRPVVRQADQPDAFGDTPVLQKDIRGESITRFPMQVTHIAGSRFASGKPGVRQNVRVFALVLKRDAVRRGWTPTDGDVVELADGDKLFVVDVQPAFPTTASLGNPNGGNGGWRIGLLSDTPRRSPAGEYEG